MVHAAGYVPDPRRSDRPQPPGVSSTQPPPNFA
ncbi:hypothetical protein SAMN04487788_1415 [Microbacterium testaceum StLB037]|uniref:Uncharacterized protein n=1 Tax=Microbacterium testaceum (strain StLB037) TaxID=979556 RepID=A0A1H0NLL7_MICTS|nr:hypothetical protein SAMN04487788_1415 [Microbacterium testaceum StLB037]